MVERFCPEILRVAELDKSKGTFLVCRCRGGWFRDLEVNKDKDFYWVY